MRLLVYWVDMRGGYTANEEWETSVIDQETGKQVGWVHSQRSPAVRHISLFNGKYQATFSSSYSRRECEVFAKGVEAVLNHITAVDDELESSKAA